jgi:hypothetical protein
MVSNLATPRPIPVTPDISGGCELQDHTVCRVFRLRLSAGESYGPNSSSYVSIDAVRGGETGFSNIVRRATQKCFLGFGRYASYQPLLWGWVAVGNCPDSSLTPKTVKYG